MRSLIRARLRTADEPNEGFSGREPFVAIAATPHNAITIDPKLVDAYAGIYRNPRTGGVVIIAREDNHLTCSGSPETAMRCSRGWAIKGRSRFTRLSDEEGKKEIAAITQRTTEEEASHVEITIDPNLLDEYVGAYRLNIWAMAVSGMPVEGVPHRKGRPRAR